MAYCPQCGREQRCGCDTCHTCGVELVSGSPTSAGDTGHQAAVPDAIGAGEATPGPAFQADEAGPRDETVQVARSAVLVVLLILGCAALVNAFLGMILSISGFPVTNSVVSIMDGLKRIGYYVGHLMYSSSYRLLLGFALVALGLLGEPPRPFKKRGTWRHAVRVLALVVFATGAGCLIAMIFLLMPVGNQNMDVTGLLPELWITLPVLAVLGLSLSATGYVLVAQFSRESKESHRIREDAVKRRYN